MDKINYNNMIDALNVLKFNKGFELFKVEEYFPLHKKRTYLIRNLDVAIEHNICYCSDFDGLLLNNFYVLSGFLLESIVEAKIIDSYAVKIIFNNGYIIIQAIHNL